MYSTKTGLIIAFHGCDQEVCDNVLNGKARLLQSENDYDWLGNGIYFWENNLKRAWQFAEELKSNPRPGKRPILQPAVLGAVIDLGECLDLMDSEYLETVKDNYHKLELSYQIMGLKLPTNKRGKGSEDLLLRNLDCLVIESLHKRILPLSFDSVRGVFWEGDELYHNAGFKEKNHIQICIRNPNCIKATFCQENWMPRIKKCDFFSVNFFHF